jgi:hypothetical protein
MRSALAFHPGTLNASDPVRSKFPGTTQAAKHSSSRAAPGPTWRGSLLATVHYEFAEKNVRNQVAGVKS